MSRKYKFYNKEGLYFVSFATVYWIDVFVRDEYFQMMVESLDYSSKNKGMEIYTWCIMPPLRLWASQPCTFNIQGQRK